MAVTGTTMILAKQLWNGERFALAEGEGVYVVKTYKETGSDVLTTRAERRLTERVWTWTWSIPFVGRRWKAWTELLTPIEAQDTGQEVYRLNRLG